MAMSATQAGPFEKQQPTYFWPDVPLSRLTFTLMYEPGWGTSVVAKSHGLCQLEPSHALLHMLLYFLFLIQLLNTSRALTTSRECLWPLTWVKVPSRLFPVGPCVHSIIVAVTGCSVKCLPAMLAPWTQAHSYVSLHLRSVLSFSREPKNSC